MGPVGAKLPSFEVFIQSIRDQVHNISALEDKNLLELTERELDYTTNILWQILSRIKASESKTVLISNSKTLHHLLPNLMPPIDREYTLRFFYNNKTIDGRDEQIFREIYPHFYIIGTKCKTQIIKNIGRDFHTSVTKVIDNAIVGYVLGELK